jgi:hypothetical protein
MKISANIPDVLYQQLESFAEKEQISIDGFVVIALSCGQLGTIWKRRLSVLIGMRLRGC